jgi:hypothetical protein
MMVKVAGTYANVVTVTNSGSGTPLVSRLVWGQAGVAAQGWSVNGPLANVSLLHVLGTLSANGQALAILDSGSNRTPAKILRFRAAGLERWAISSNFTAVAETGGNVGNDLTIKAFDDAGALLSTPLTITRSTGAVTVGTKLVVPNGTAPSEAAAFGQIPTSWPESATIGLVADLAATEKTANKGAANGYASLDSGTHIPVNQLPAFVMNTVWPAVANQAAMLALAAEPGDVAVRSDVPTNFMLASLPASTLGNWVALNDATAPVTSVAGRTGAVTLASTDVSGLGSASTANKVAAGSVGVLDATDASTSNARTPTALSVVDASVSTTAAIAESKLALASDAAATTASRRSLGPGVTQAPQGNRVPERYALNGSNDYRESFDRRYISVSVTPGTGVMALTAVVLHAGDVVTNLHFVSSATLTMGSNSDGHLWFALYSPTLSLLSQSADQGGAATWAIKTWKSLALAAPQTIATFGVYYAAVMINAGTGGAPVMPSLYAADGLSSALTGSGNTGQPSGQKTLSATNGTALTATAPAGPIALAALAQQIYACTS